MDAPRPASPRPRGTELREQLIAAAAREFARRGYSGASISELAAAAGVSKNQLFHYFPSKEKLALAALEFAGALWHSDVAQHAEMQGQARERLRAGFTRVAELSRTADWPGLRLLAALLAAPDTLPPELRAAATLQRDSLLEFFRALIKELKREGRLSAEHKSRPLAGLIVAQLLGATLIVAADGSERDAASAALSLLADLIAP